MNISRNVSDSEKMDIHIREEKLLVTNAQSYQKAEAPASTLVLADKLSFPFMSENAVTQNELGLFTA